jgi:hypothetical protein
VGREYKQIQRTAASANIGDERFAGETFFYEASCGPHGNPSARELEKPPLLGAKKEFDEPSFLLYIQNPDYKWLKVREIRYK